MHKSDDDVLVYSRNSNDVTATCPEVAERLRGISARTVVLDGEAIALDPEGRPHPFQTTMRRFGRKLDVAALRTAFPLSSSYFDCLFLDGCDLTSCPELVVAIAFNDIQKSPHDPGGLALRFARLKAYRGDKDPEEADTIERVREIYRKRTGESLVAREKQLELW